MRRGVCAGLLAPLLLASTASAAQARTALRSRDPSGSLLPGREPDLASPSSTVLHRRQRRRPTAAAVLGGESERVVRLRGGSAPMAASVGAPPRAAPPPPRAVAEDKEPTAEEQAREEDTLAKRARAWVGHGDVSPVHRIDRFGVEIWYRWW